MKKRLLSALLALVMVLAMLPATAFAADDPGVSVTYYTEGQKVKEKQADGTTDEKSIPADGWYETNTVTSVSSGIIVGSNGTVNTATGAMTAPKSGTLYTTVAGALAKGTNLMLLSSQTISTDKTSLTVNLNGVSSSSITMTKGGTLSVGNSSTTAATATIAVSQSDDKSATGATVNLGANVSATVSVPEGRTNTVNLYNAEVTSGLTMNGVGTVNSKATDAKQVLKLVGASSSITGNVTVTGANSTISVSNNTITGDVDLTGKSSKATLSTGTITGDLTVTGAQTEVDASNRSTLGGDVTLTASDADADKGLAAPKLTLSNSTITGKLTIEAKTQTKASVVTLSNNGVITGDTKLENAAVSMTSSHVGKLDLEKGSLTVGDKENDGSTLGTVTLGEVEAVNLKVSGGNITFTEIKMGAKGVSKVELEGATNNYGKLALGDYKSTETAGNRGLMSGSIGSGTDLDRNWLYGKETYQIIVSGGGSFFAGAEDFQTLVDKYNKDAENTNIAHLGGEGEDFYPVTFTVDGKELLVISAKKNAVITLPAKVSTYDTTDWVDGDGTHRPAGKSYVVTKEATLSSLGEYLDVTSITKVSAKPDGIKAEVKNGVITLSGALELPGGSGNATSIILTVETNDGTKNSVLVSYLHDTKATEFTSAAYLSGGGGSNKRTVDIDGYTNQLTLQNGAKYGINGSGLKKMVNVTIDGVSNGQVVVGRVNVPGYTTDAAKKILIDAIQGTADDATNSTVVDFSKSPAVLEGLNAAIAAMADSQVTGWINQAQQNQFNADVNDGTLPKGSKFADQTKPYKGLDDVYVVAYLNMEVSVYNKDTTPGTMTMTLTPYYRVEVRDGSGVNNDVVVVKAGTALTSLGTDWGETSVKFNVEDGFKAPASGNAWAHQGSYVYETTITAGETVEFKTLNGFGSFVLNGIAPKVQLVNVNADDSDKAAVYFDTLQAAVDQAENKGKITVLDTTYKLEPITLNGVARKFTVNTNGAGAVTVTNATGVTVDHEANTHTYVVQLTKDNVTAATTAEISVATGITNGTVTLSTTRARANTSVEVTTTPAVGYLTRNLTATARTADNKNTTVAVTKTADNKYTFTVPAGATSITVTPTFALNTGLPFTDVAADNSYFEAVKYVYNRGMMNGVPAANGTTIFDGYSTITRGQVVTILYRLSNSPSASTYSGFNDVPSNQYYAAPITWAYSNGIVGGYGNGQFGPNDPITREQLAKILRDYSAYRGLNVTNSTSLTGYSDAGSVHDWAQAGMQWAVGNGIVTGTTTTTLTPGGNAQRYHAATMLMRYCNSFGL